MTTLTLFGRRWFDRHYGNTYHSVDVILDGKTVWQSGIHYGYGDQYTQTAFEWLDKSGLVPDREHYQNGSSEAPWIWAERYGITYQAQAADVARKRDL